MSLPPIITYLLWRLRNLMFWSCRSKILFKQNFTLKFFYVTPFIQSQLWRIIIHFSNTNKQSLNTSSFCFVCWGISYQNMTSMLFIVECCDYSRLSATWLWELLLIVMSGKGNYFWQNSLDLIGIICWKAEADQK